MPPDENPQPPLSREELQAQANLSKLRRRIPRIQGVTPDGLGG